MNKIMIGALVAGVLAAQSAAAAVRTFEFTSTITSVMSLEDMSATIIAGPVNGTTVAAGDLIKGSFSFDDQGHDWNASTGSTPNQAAISLSYTLLKTNTTIGSTTPTWEHEVGNNFSRFTLAGSSSSFHNIYFESTPGNFSWDLDDANTATFNARWYTPLPSFFDAQLTSLTEVSPVPEPSTYAMLLLGAAVAAGVSRRRARRAA